MYFTQKFSLHYCATLYEWLCVYNSLSQHFRPHFGYVYLSIRLERLTLFVIFNSYSKPQCQMHSRVNMACCCLRWCFFFWRKMCTAVVHQASRAILRNLSSVQARQYTNRIIFSSVQAQCTTTLMLTALIRFQGYSRTHRTE